MKTCTHCDAQKPFEQFSRFVRARDGRSPWCKECTAASNRAYKQRNRETLRLKRVLYYRANGQAIRAKNATWKEANPERQRFLQRRSHLKRFYGITPDQYDAIIEAQGGGCGICGAVSEKRMHVDHDHACCPGRRCCGSCVRGILCLTCNRLLGWFENNRESIERHLQREAHLAHH